MSIREQLYSIAESTTGSADEAMGILKRQNEENLEAGVFSGAREAQIADNAQGGGVKSKLAGGLVKMLFGGPKGGPV